MRIAYVGNFSQPHCTENHLALTLEDMGHEVTRIQETTGPSQTWVDQVQGHDLFLFTRTWGKMVTLTDLRMIHYWNIPTVSYHLDLYVGLKREDGLADDPFWRTDYVFTPDGSPQAAEVFKAQGINHHYMKPGVFKPECYMAQPGGKPMGNSVVFVGGGSPTGEGPQYGHTEWPYRGELLKFLRDTYGLDYSKFGWPQETIRNAELNQLYANSDVVVGDSLCIGFHHPNYWSDRVYETLGRGGFIIHPYIKGMEEEFVDGKHLVYYEFGNLDDLKSKIDYYLSNPEERKRIRRAGHEFVRDNATYHDRLKQMLGVVHSHVNDFPIPHDPADDANKEEKSRMLNRVIAGHGLPIKISLGAGTEPEHEEDATWINTDIVRLPGIDVVHNLMQYPWPFADESAEYIKAKDIIEHMSTHLPDGRNSVIAFVEECHRILKPGGTLWIQTPSWDADFLWIDPTHVRGFDIRSFDFFDPETDFGKSTGFYSERKFKVTAERTENGNLQFTMVKL